VVSFGWLWLCSCARLFGVVCGRDDFLGVCGCRACCPGLMLPWRSCYWCTVCDQPSTGWLRVFPAAAVCVACVVSWVAGWVELADLFFSFSSGNTVLADLSQFAYRLSAQGSLTKRKYRSCVARLVPDVVPGVGSKVAVLLCDLGSDGNGRHHGLNGRVRVYVMTRFKEFWLRTRLLVCHVS